MKSLLNLWGDLSIFGNDGYLWQLATVRPSLLHFLPPLELSTHYGAKKE